MDAAKKYEYIKTLGEGSYGHVWLCRDRERDCLVAIKKFKDANKDSQAYHLAMREIKLLRATSHEHVVSVIEAFRSQSSGNVYLVMEYAESCLNLELKKHRTGLPTSDVMRITWQLASALQYLHSRKIVHRDLKPANILLTAAGDLKLCDFGFARDLPPAGAQADMSSYVTTRWYRAPEVVVGADYGAAVDIWALGCLFAELLNGQPLFPGASNMDQLALIVACFGHLPNRLLAKALTNPQLVGVQLRTGNPRNWAVALQQRFAPYGENAVTLLLSCLNPDPLKRATADEVLRSAYFEPIRQKKVSSLNGQPSIAITITTSAPTAVTQATAVPALSSATAAGPVHPATAITAPAGAAAAVDSGSVVLGGKSAKDSTHVTQQQQQPLAQQQQLQQPAGVVAPSLDSARRTSKDAEPQPERQVPAATVHAAATMAISGNVFVEVLGPMAGAMQAPAPAAAATGTSSEPLTARQGPVHPMIMVPRQAPAAEASAKDGAQNAGLGTGSGAGIEVDTPPAAPSQPNGAQAQRQGTQVRFLPQTLPAASHGQAQSQTQGQDHGQGGAEQVGGVSVNARLTAVAPSVMVAVGPLHEAGGSEAAKQQQQQRDARPPPNVSYTRASVASISMSSVSAAARSMTDTGVGTQGAVQAPALAVPGKAGSTLIQHNKRASEHSIGMYGNHRGPGAGIGGGSSDMPMRLARVSLVNPTIEVTQLAAENAPESSSPSATPTDASAALVPVQATTNVVPANPTPIASGANPPASTAVGLMNGLSGGNSAPPYGTTSRRRSTATGSRLTRVSHTCEGQDQQLRDDDSEEDRSSERLSFNGSQGGLAPNGGTQAGSLAAPGVVVGSGLHPSPRMRHSRLASVTEPGGQHPAGASGAAGAAAAVGSSGGGANANATDGGGYDHVNTAQSRGPSAPQMLSPLGRCMHQFGNHHGVNPISAGLGPGPMSNPGHVMIVSDSGHNATHGHLHSAMSAVSLNVFGAVSTVARERERDRDAIGETGGMLRSNAVLGITTPAAPTASQRSFTSQAVSTSAAAAGLMSRPVSNLYINLEQHGVSNSSCSRAGPQDAAECNSTDSSAAVSPSTPTGANGGGGGQASAASAAGPAAPAAGVNAAAVSVGRRTTFTDGPSSMFKSVLRTLSTRRSNTSSHTSTGAEQPITAAAPAGAAIAGVQPAAGMQPANSIGGAPVLTSHSSVNAACGTMHSLSSASSGGVSPFIPSRASSHNFITGAPSERVPMEVTSSLSVPGVTEDYMAAAAAAASLRRSVTVTHGSTVGLGVGGNSRIGLPHLNVRIPEAASGGPAAVANGYGSAVVSPASRRRSQLAAQPARTSDAGIMMNSVGLRQTSTGSMGMVPGHQGCKLTTSLHGEVVAVPGLVGGGAALPVVRNPAPPAEAPPTRLAPGKGGRDIS